MNARAPVLKEGVTLYLVRHGETDWNKTARYQGQTDIPLNDTGRQQAARNGAILAKLTGIARADFVASPLSRAIETMEIIRAELGLESDDYRLDPRLLEVSYGHWEGQLASDLPLSDPAGVAGKHKDPFGWRPTGGESYADLEVRVCDWLRSLTRDTVAIAHGGVSRVTRGVVLDLERAKVPVLEVPQDKVLVIKDGTMAWI